MKHRTRYLLQLRDKYRCRNSNLFQDVTSTGCEEAYFDLCTCSTAQMYTNMVQCSEVCVVSVNLTDYMMQLKLLN